MANTQTPGRTQQSPTVTHWAWLPGCLWQVAHGAPLTFHPRDLPRTVSAGLQRKSSESDLQKAPPLNHSLSQIVNFKIVWTWERNDRVEGLLLTLEKHLQTPILNCKMQDLTQWGTWNKDRGETISYRELSELQARHCWPVFTGCSSLLPLASLSQNTWVFWELLTSLHLFSIYSKRVPISGRLWGSAAIYMINKRMFYLLGMWVYFFAWNVFDCTWSVLDCTSLVKDYMAILASMKSAKSDLWSWKTRFKSLKNSHL